MFKHDNDQTSKFNLSHFVERQNFDSRMEDLTLQRIKLLLRKSNISLRPS